VSFEERLTRLFEMQFADIEAQPELATVLLMETRQSNKFYGEPVRDVLRSYAGAIDDLLRRGIADGALRQDLDIPLARRILVGALEEIELDWLLGDRSRALSTQAAPLASMLLHGFSAPPR